MPQSDRSPCDWLRSFLNRHTGNGRLERSDAGIEARLRDLLRDRGLPSLAALVKQLQAEPQRGAAHCGPLGEAVIAALMNHETSFFRDTSCFAALEHHVLPQLIARRAASRRLSIWSAACSTGQEPHSLAILLGEAFPLEAATWRIDIVATDVSPAAVARTAEARYSTLEIRRGLSDARRVAAFTPDRQRWGLHPKIAARVTPVVHNLLDPPRDLVAGPFDLVLLRNVLIYLSPEARLQVLEHVASVLRSDGYLILGAPESLLDVPMFTRDVFGSLRAYRKAR